MYMVEEYEAGINIRRDDIEQCVQKILNMRESDVIEMKQKARKVFEEHFSED